jgi:site-specific DNA recombinase
MIRAAIYARYSDEKQNNRSIEDQIALCRDICAREAMAVIATFEDRAISGAGAINRPGFQNLMRAAEAGLFDVIVAEDMDRVFRNQADYHTHRERLDFRNIEIHTASGKVGKLDGSLRVLMDEMFIENLLLHTRRGLEGVIRDGRHAGGRAFGYRAVPGKPGELEIVEEKRPKSFARFSLITSPARHRGRSRTISTSAACARRAVSYGAHRPSTAMCCVAAG